MNTPATCHRLVSGVLLLLATCATASQLYVIPILDVPRIFRLTSWLDNGTNDNGWWANPALAAAVREPLVETVNVSPISGLYTISSVRFTMPAPSGLVWGAEILGAGPDQTGKLDATGAGVQYSSRFIFTRPSFQLLLAWRSSHGFQAGALLGAGFERQRVTVDESELFGLGGLNLGVVSPWAAGIWQAGLAYSMQGHFQSDRFWERDLRFIMRARLPDSLVHVSAEYTLSLNESNSPLPFDGVKSADILQIRGSWRPYTPFGILIGFSSDFLNQHYLYRPGTNIHAGLEIWRSRIYPFYGGYEIASSLDGNWYVFHRFWFGYRIGSRKA